MGRGFTRFCVAFWRAIALILLVIPVAAQAKWLEASSQHFVVYADDSPANVRKFSEELERFHAATAIVTNVQNDVPPSPSNRVTVFVVRSIAQVQNLYGGNTSNVAGFYRAQAGRSIAFVPQVSGGSRELDFSKIILLHEYVHHFMMVNGSFALPRWMSEGTAEFLSSASFLRDGGVSLGRPANHRAGELFFGRDITAADLFDFDVSGKMRGSKYEAFYGKSWLLFHFLTFEESRRGQLTQYLKLLGEGKTSREAAEQAFGNLGVLERDLDRYIMRPRISAFNIPASGLRVGEITMRELSAGEAAMMAVRTRSNAGVTEGKMADGVLAQARSIAARFPQDAAVLSALAEAEFDAGNDSEAIAAADAALAIDSKQVNAYVQKGYALFRIARDAQDKDAAFRLARQPFLALNKLEPDHPLPLMYNYMTYSERGRTPTANAIAGLEQALALAPFDTSLRLMTARQQLRDGRREIAKSTLRPLVFNPHAGGMASRVRNVITKIDNEPTWQGDEWNALFAGRTDNDDEIRSNR